MRMTITFRLGSTINSAQADSFCAVHVNEIQIAVPYTLNPSDVLLQRLRFGRPVPLADDRSTYLVNANVVNAFRLSGNRVRA